MCTPISIGKTKHKVVGFARIHPIIKIIIIIPSVLGRHVSLGCNTQAHMHYWFLFATQSKEEEEEEGREDKGLGTEGMKTDGKDRADTLLVHDDS